MPKNKRASQKEDYINYLDPIVNGLGKNLVNKPWRKARNQSIAVLSISAIIVAIALFFPLQGFEFAWIIIGLILGIALFVSLYFMFSGISSEKRENNPEYISFKEKYSPAQRLRVGLGSYVGLIIVLVVLLSSLPNIAGGIIAVSAALGIFSFIQMTPEEYKSFVEGEIDPRDLADIEEMSSEEDEIDIDEEKLRQRQEYLDLVNSMPKEQQAILLNPELNGNLSVFDEDDIKDGKRRSKRKGK